MLTRGVLFLFDNSYTHASFKLIWRRRIFVLLSLDNEHAYMAEADMALDNVMKRRRGDLILQDNGRADTVQVDMDQKIEEEERKFDMANNNKCG